jgi:hypothetical protein
MEWYVCFALGEKMRKITEKYICKCKCGTIRVLNEEETIAPILMFQHLRFYECKKCKIRTLVWKIDSLSEFKPIEYKKIKPSFDPRDNDHQ